MRSLSSPSSLRSPSASLLTAPETAGSSALGTPTDHGTTNGTNDTAISPSIASALGTTIPPGTFSTPSTGNTTTPDSATKPGTTNTPGTTTTSGTTIHPTPNTSLEIVSLTKIDLCSSTPHQQEFQRSSTMDLEAENGNLRSQVAHLKHQVKVILDHSIESDTRLMEYTDEVFTVPRRGCIASTTATALTTAETAVQCELPVACRDELCAGYKTLITSLRTTVEVLEAEILCLKNEAKRCDCKNDTTLSAKWTVQVKNKRPPLNLKNRFEPLSEGGQHPLVPVLSRENLFQATQRKPNNTSKKTNSKRGGLVKNNSHCNNKNPRQTGKKKLSFRSVKIESDSHGRHLAKFIQELVESDTSVTGVVKPGAKLLDVAPCLPTPPRSCTVLIAGTNDLDAGQQSTIYQHLEERIVAKLDSSNVIVATLPHRHDLPVHHIINHNTELVNRHIRNLTSKYDAVEIVDFNRIGRRLFTSHGMHLRMPGKRLLARLVLESLERVDAAATTWSAQYASLPPAAAFTPVAVPSPSAETSHAEPLILAHDTFADAVKQGPSPRRKAVGEPPSPKNFNFLDKVQGHQCQV